jgi:hypothetical protein
VLLHGGEEGVHVDVQDHADHFNGFENGFQGFPFPSRVSQTLSRFQNRIRACQRLQKCCKQQRINRFAIFTA